MPFANTAYLASISRFSSLLNAVDSSVGFYWFMLKIQIQREIEIYKQHLKMFDLKFVIIFEQLCGKTLEGEEKFSNFADGSQIEEEKAWSETPAPKMDALIALMETASSHSSEETKKIVKALLDTRTNERWATAEVENKKAREDAAKVLAKPAPRKSAAIRIEV